MRPFSVYTLCVLQSAAGWAQQEDLFEFFHQEAQVITASRRPQPLYRAPATVYVVSGEELRSSGAQTLWDGLRRVPGMDVASIRSLGGVVSSRHHLWSVYFEDEWRLARLWTLWSSGRLDHHPHNGVVLSPRFSLVFVPVNEHVVRLSTGTSFRNPTQLETHMEVTERVATSGDLPDLEVHIQGNTGLDPERMVFAELVHNAHIGRLRTVVGLFHYRLRDVVAIGQPVVDLAQPGTIGADVTFANSMSMSTRRWTGRPVSQAVAQRWGWRRRAGDPGGGGPPADVQSRLWMAGVPVWGVPWQ